MNYTKILYIFSIIFIILIFIYILLNFFGNNKATTTPTYSVIDLDEIDINNINSYIEKIQKNPENITIISEITKKLSKLCPYFNDVFNYNDIPIKNIVLQYLIDLSNYKKGLIDKKYMDKWYNICNGLENLKKNPFIKN